MQETTQARQYAVIISEKQKKVKTEFRAKLIRQPRASRASVGRQFRGHLPEHPSPELRFHQNLFRSD